MPGLYAVATPIPATPAKHGMVASASPDATPARWQLGYTICPENCVEVSTWDPDCTSWPDGDPPEKSEAADNLACYDVDPFVIETSFECSSHGFSTQDYPGRARRQLEAATSKALEFETWTGTLKPDNPHLTDGAVVLASGAPVDVITGLGLLGQALSNCAHGGKGTIHATTLVVDSWMGMPGNLVVEVGQRLETANRGDTVISGTGYPGTGPEGVEPAAGTVWAYATGPVQYRLDDIVLYPDTISEAMDRAHNKIQYRAERFAASNFDPCCHFAILLDVAALGGSGGGGGDGAWTAPQVAQLLASNSAIETATESALVNLTAIETATEGLIAIEINESMLNASRVAIVDDLFISTITGVHGWSVHNTTAGPAQIKIRFGNDGADTPFITIDLAEAETVTYAFPTPLACTELFVTFETGTVDGLIYYKDA